MNNIEYNNTNIDTTLGNVDELSDNEKKVLHKYIRRLYRKIVNGTLLFSILVLPVTLYSLGSFLNFDILGGIIAGVLAVLLTFGLVKLFGKRGVLHRQKIVKCLKHGKFVVQREVILKRDMEYDRSSIRNDSFLWHFFGGKLIYDCCVTTEHFESIEVYGVEVMGKTNGRWLNMQEGKLACMLYIPDVNDVICIAGGDDEE